MLGKSPIKWGQRPDMTIAVEGDVKHQFKQTLFACPGNVNVKPAIRKSHIALLFQAILDALTS